MQPHPGLDAELAVQPVGHLGHLPARCLECHHAGAAFQIPLARQPHKACGLQRGKPLQKPAGEGQLVGQYRAFRLLTQPQKTLPQAQNARQIQGARLEPVRQKGGDLLGVAQAAGAAAEQRVQLLFQPLGQHQPAGALGPSSPL